MKALGLALVGLAMSACVSAGGAHHRLASRMYLVRQDQGPAEFRVLQALELPLSGELYLYPRWLQLHVPGAPSRGGIRLQTALRVVRSDGSIVHWWLGSERSAPSGEGGRSIHRESLASGTTTLSFGQVRLGPLRLDGVVGVEVLISELPRPVDPAHPRLVGAAALARAPVLGAGDIEALDHAAAATARAGGVLRMATHVPIIDKSASPGRHRLEVLLVGQEGDDACPDDLERADPARASPWIQFAPDRWRLVLSLGVEVDVQDHERLRSGPGGDHVREP